MTDIFTEVEQDLRREQARRLWNRFGIYIILLAVLVVLVVAGWRGYEAWATSRARAAGDAFASSLAAAEGLNTASSGDALVAYAADAPDGYAMLARFRAATAYAEGDDAARAEEVLRAIADDASVPPLYRDAARVRLAAVLVDAGNADAAEAAVAALAEDTANPMSPGAQEMMGLAAFVRDDREATRRWFTALRDGAGVAAERQQRARLMVDLLDQTGAPAAPEPTAAAAAPAAPQETE